MEIDYSGFTPLASLIGGAMIGLAALLLMAANGRVMGVSGILSGIIRPDNAGDVSWRVLFVIGAIIGPFIVWLIQGEPITIQPVASGLILPIAGFFVGIGTAIGAGCTSGHGICGIGRLSLRSIVGTCIFVGSGVMTVFITKSLGWVVL